MRQDDRTGTSNEYWAGEPLTQREIEIIRLIADGLSNRKIASELVLAPETIKWYNKQIFNKLGVHNRTEAAIRARSMGLLSSSDANGTASGSPSETTVRYNLPSQMTSFVGRQQEIAAITEQLSQARLLTLIGPAGAGKTRLALQIAAAVSQNYVDGVVFIPLATVTKKDSILWTIAEHLNVQFHPQEDPLGQLAKYLSDKTLLLVLDNFEHLVDKADVLLSILRDAVHIKILATSRERLNLYGEMVHVIGGLALPESQIPDQATRCESVELFIHRAYSVNPYLKLDEDTVLDMIRICHLVEGMPLGIELAATWVDVLSPEKIAAEIQQSLDILETELRGVPQSQKSMRAAFSRSWNLLYEEQKIAFRRLAVFRDGFTLQAVESIAGVNVRTLQSLINKSMLRYNPDMERYEMHELLRQYAEEQLEAAGEFTDVLELHARYYADFMEECWGRIRGGEQKAAFYEVESDIENVRSAWHYWIQKSDIPLLQKFLHGLWAIYDVRGWYPAGIDLFEQGVILMRSMDTEEAQIVLGWLLAVQGLFNLMGGVYSSVQGSRAGFVLAQEGMQILDQLAREDEMMIVPLHCQFMAAFHVHRLDVASETAERCLQVAARMDDIWATARARKLLAILAIREKDYEQAGYLAQESLNSFEKTGDLWSLSILCIEVLGLLEITRQEFDRANDVVRRGLEAAEEIAFEYSRQAAYFQLGYIAALQNNYSEAGHYWHQAVKIGTHIMGSPIAVGFAGSGTEWGGREVIND